MAAVPDAVRRALARHQRDIAGCLLYLDAGAAEAVAAGVGPAALEGLGAATVFDLATASPADLGTAALLSGAPGPIRRATLLVTTLLGQAEQAVLAACHHCSAVAQFTVLSCVSAEAHADEQPGVYGPQCFAAVAAEWQRRLNEPRLAAGSGPCSLAIVHCPLLLVPLTSGAFVLPSACAAADLPHAGRLAAGFSTSAVAAAAEDSDEEGRPAGGSGRGSRGSAGQPSRPGSAGGAGGAPAAGHSLLAHALVDAVATLGFRPEAFSLGPFSRLVCRSMAFVPALAGDAPSAALVVVDRCLDPVSPSLHGDLLVARMFDCLQQQQGGSGGGISSSSPFASACPEVALPSFDAPALAEVGAEGAAGAAAGGGSGGSEAAASLLPGSLRHPDDPQAERWLEFLLSRRGRDAPMFLRKWLKETARKENAPPTQRFKPGSVTAAELRCLSGALRQQSAATAHRHASLLQLAEAAAAALEGGHADHWEAVQREERSLLFACAESSQAAAAHLSELCQLAGRPGGTVSLADAALLVVAAYCLLPGLVSWFASSEGGQVFTPQQEAALREALASAVLAAEGPGSSTSGAAGSSSSSAAHPAWPLQQLADRVAAAKAAGAAGSTSSSTGGDGSSPAAEDLETLKLEAWEEAERLLASCRRLAAFRLSQLKQQQGQGLARLAEVGQDGAPRHTPLLRQVVEHILRDQPLPDLHAGATSLKGLLKSGLGRFGLHAAPKPSDCSTVILFVVGGISLAEVHDIMQAVDERAAQAASSSAGSGPGAASASKPPPRILVGASGLLRPIDVCSQLFADLRAD